MGIKDFRFEDLIDISNGKVTVKDIPGYVSRVREIYSNGAEGEYLNDLTASRLENALRDNPTADAAAGLPGLHAEVRALNALYNSHPSPTTINPGDINIATIKLGESSKIAVQGGDFPACTNCQKIIPPTANVMTGKWTRSAPPRVRSNP